MGFASSTEAKRAGWFSRRHETDEANKESRRRYQLLRGPKARKLKAYARGAERPKSETHSK